MSAADELVDDVNTDENENNELDTGINFLDMSDEEMLAAEAPVSKPVTFDAATGKEVDEDTEDKGTGATDAAAEDGDEPADKAADGATGEGDENNKPVTEAKADDKPAGDEVKDKVQEAAAVDYEAEYKRILAPFKANGKDIAVESVDDAIALMQMGANYNKKMAALKPNLKLMKMLENSGFMSEEKIGFLIDLGKKDPAAINKLVKEAGIDPMDLDAGKADAYKQSTYAAADAEIDLDTVLDELQGSATYTRTLDVVSNKWDVASKQIVSQNPQLLKVIDDHMARGIYDQISNELERERVLGRLNGLSDIEAYRKVGDSIQARGGFAHLAAEKTDQGTTKAAVVPGTVITPKTKVEDDKLKDKKRAAGSAQPAAPSTTPKDFNPLSMSDEEFAKLGTKYL